MQSNQDLLVLDLQAHTSYSQAMHYASEATHIAFRMWLQVEEHLPRGVKLLWLEEYFLKNASAPQMSSQLF